MAITAFLSRSPGLLNRGPEGPASLGHGPHSSIFSPTDQYFLSPGLYNNLTSTLLPASVTISHSIQPLDSHGRPLISLTGCTYYLHRCISSFDSLAGSEVNIQQILFVDFANVFNSIHRRNMEKILLAFGLPKETVAAIKILHKNTKVKVCSPDGDRDYFNIVASMLQGDTLAPYFFIICLDYVLRTSIDKMKENSFKLTKERSRRYPHKQLRMRTMPMTLH